MPAITNATFIQDGTGVRRLVLTAVPAGYAAGDTLVIPGINTIDNVSVTVVSSSAPVSASTSTPVFAAFTGNTVTLSAGTSVPLALNLLVFGH